MIKRVDINQVGECINTLFNLLTNGEKEVYHGGTPYTLNDLHLIDKVHVIEDGEEVGLIEVQWGTHWSDKYIRLAYKIKDKPIEAIVAKPSYLVSIEFKIKQPTAMEYVKNFVHIDTLTGAFMCKYARYFESYTADLDTQKERELEYKSLNETLHTLCKYEILLNEDKTAVELIQDLNPVEFYASLVLANNYRETYTW